MTVLSHTKCTLGEGVFWHPDRGSFLWFDILEKRLYEARDEGEHHWQFDRYVSAAGRVDADRLLVATQTDLILFDLGTGAQERLVALEEDNPVTRCNDGRADPFGGFWIGTMGLGLETGAGAIYRYYKGELRQLFAGLSIPNAQCFSPDGGFAYFTDTAVGIVQRVRLDRDGWPEGAPEDWLMLKPRGLNPDGAVIDAEGRFWNALWGSGAVVCFGPDGAELDRVALPATQTTCPAFGGPDLNRLAVTSAAEGLPDETEAGKTFVFDLDVQGQEEHRVVL